MAVALRRDRQESANDLNELVPGDVRNHGASPPVRLRRELLQAPASVLEGPYAVTAPSRALCTFR